MVAKILERFITDKIVSKKLLQISLICGAGDALFLSLFFSILSTVLNREFHI